VSFFVNLHTLPAGQHMYTAWVTYDEPGKVEDADEIDVVLPAGAAIGSLQKAIMDTREFRELYPGARIVGIVDQSAGEKVWAEEGLER
jgi:hypothetical protein